MGPLMNNILVSDWNIAPLMNNILVFRLEFSCFIIGAIYMRLARGVEGYYEISRIALLCSSSGAVRWTVSFGPWPALKSAATPGCCIDGPWARRCSRPGDALLHRWARGPPVQRTWRRLDCSFQFELTIFSIRHTSDVG